MDSLKSFLLSSEIFTRRGFLRVLLLGGILSLFGKKVKAEKKPENNLKEAMFWRKLD